MAQFDPSKHDRNRRGEFTQMSREDAGQLDLTDPQTVGAVAAAQWADPSGYGDVSHISEGSRTPWGAAQNVEFPAPGIAVVDTAGHGGIKLSPERNRGIPAALRRTSGWYEEDCEASIVGMHHPEVFSHRDRSADEVRADCTRSVKDWFPDEYAAATGQSVSASESAVLRKRSKAEDAAAFRQAHQHEFVSTGWGVDSNGSWVPEGHYVVSARLDATGDEREFLVPAAEAVTEHRLRSNIVIDPNRHVDVTGVGGLGNPVQEKHPVQHDLGVDVDSLSPSSRARAEKELGTRYRFPDGVRTLRDDLERGGVTGKAFSAFDGKKATYYVQLADGEHIHPVSKATYDALAGVPERMKESSRLSVRIAAAEVRREKARANADIDAAIRIGREVDRLRAELSEANVRESADVIPWQERQTMRAAALAALLAEKGVEL